MPQAHRIPAPVERTMPNFVLDVRFAIRRLGRAPAFAALVLLTLGVGAAASTAIFSAVNEVILRPLAVHEPDRLVMLWESNEERGWNRVEVAPANALDWRERVRSFEDVALLGEHTRTVAFSDGQKSFPIALGEVGSNAFDVLGARALHGRVFTTDDSWAESAPVAVLTHRAWTRYLGADPRVIGRMMRLDGVSFQIVGVLPETFALPLNDAEIWTTLRWTAARRQSIWFRQAHVVRAIARLRDGATTEGASRELSAVAAQLSVEHPQTNRGMLAGLTPLHEFLVGDRKLPLLVLLAAVGLLQLLVCANVANLLLARTLGRHHELAVRRALGAGRGRLARQALTECLVLAVGGAVLGLFLASYGLELLEVLRPAELPALSFRLDWRVLSFSIAVATGSALLFGAQPAMASARFDVQQGLAEGGRTGSMGRRRLLGAHALSAFEIALAVMLVAGAGLMVRSIGKLRDVPPGANFANVLTFDLIPPSGTYRTDDDRAAFAQRVAARIQEIGGVRHAGVGRSLPFAGHGWTSDFTIAGWPVDRFGTDVSHREATAGYFRALEIPLRQGALFPDLVAPGTPHPVIVNQAFVDRYFPNESPVGRRITFDRAPDSTSYWYSITGVVGNERMVLTAEPRPEIIAHLAADTPSRLRFVVKTEGEPLRLADEIRGAIASIDPEVPVIAVRPMDAVVAEALARDRFLMAMLGVFAVVALALAALGVYGVATQATRVRLREIGIRLALGAAPRDVLRTLMVRGATFAGLGVAAGIAGTLLLGRGLDRLLFDVRATDPITLGVVTTLLGLVAVAAILTPARRAMRVDPVRVLRSE
jgi:putative ABC transport system permease protein